MRTATPRSPDAAISGGLPAPSAQAVKVGCGHRHDPDKERENQHPLLRERQRLADVDASASAAAAAAVVRVQQYCLTEAAAVGLRRLCQLVEIAEDLFLRTRVRDGTQLELDAIVYLCWNKRCERRSRRYDHLASR